MNYTKNELLLDLYYAFLYSKDLEYAKQKYKDNNLVLEILNKSEIERLNKIKEKMKMNKYFKNLYSQILFEIDLFNSNKNDPNHVIKKETLLYWSELCKKIEEENKNE